MSIIIEEVIAETTAAPRQETRRGSRPGNARNEPQQALIQRRDLERCNALIHSRRDRLDAE